MPRAINLWVDPEDVLLEGIEHSLSSDRCAAFELIFVLIYPL